MPAFPSLTMVSSTDDTTMGQTEPTSSAAADELADNLTLSSSVLPVTNATMPPDMVFSDAHVISICGYSVLFVVSATLNLQVLSNLLRAKRHVGLSRLNTLLLQLVLADLLVRRKFVIT